MQQPDPINFHDVLIHYEDPEKLMPLMHDFVHNYYDRYFTKIGTLVTDGKEIRVVAHIYDATEVLDPYAEEIQLQVSIKWILKAVDDSITPKYLVDVNPSDWRDFA